MRTARRFNGDWMIFEAARLQTLQPYISDIIRLRRIAESEVARNGDDLPPVIRAVLHAVQDHFSPVLRVFLAVDMNVGRRSAEIISRLAGCQVSELFGTFQQSVEHFFRRAVEITGQERAGRAFFQPFDPDFFRAPDVQQCFVKRRKTGRHLCSPETGRFVFQPLHDEAVCPEVVVGVIFQDCFKCHGGHV